MRYFQHAETGEVFGYDSDQADLAAAAEQDPTLAEITGSWPPPPAGPTAADVIAERDRRLAQGFDHDFGDERGVHRIGTTPDDLRGWQEVTDASNAAIALGQPNATFTIVTDTGPAVVTALEWQGVLAAATAHRQPIWAASFALQALDPIPADFADDTRWP